MQKPLISVEQASCEALASWLQSYFANDADVEVFAEWANPEILLKPKAITIIQAGNRVDDYTDPHVVSSEAIHKSLSPRIVIPNANSEVSAIALVNAINNSYEIHRLNGTTIHEAPDNSNITSLSNIVDLNDAIILANRLKDALTGHFIYQISHPNTDSHTKITAPNATDLASLIILVNNLKTALNTHYNTKIYIWMIKSCRLPVQLDVWTHYNATRDNLILELEYALNANPYDTASFGIPSGEPVRNGPIFKLSSGHYGTVDFDFNEPTLLETEDLNQQRQFRAYYRGFADFALTLKAQSPILSQINLKDLLDNTTEEKTITI